MTRRFLIILVTTAVLAGLTGGLVAHRVSGAEAAEAERDRLTGSPAVERAIERGWLLRSDLSYSPVQCLAIYIARDHLGHVRQAIIDDETDDEIRARLDTAVEHMQFIVESIGRESDS